MTARGLNFFIGLAPKSGPYLDWVPIKPQFGLHRQSHIQILVGFQLNNDFDLNQSIFNLNQAF